MKFWSKQGERALGGVAVLFLAFAVAFSCGCSHRKSAVAGGANPGNSKLVYTPLGSGIEYAEFERSQPPLVYHVGKVNLKGNRLRLGVLTLPDSCVGKMTVAKIVAAATNDGRYVCAALSGDYFGGQVIGPWGIEIAKGRITYSPCGRSAFLVAPDGTPLIMRPRLTLEAQFGTNTLWHSISDMNRLRHGQESGLHLYCCKTRQFYSVVAPARAAWIDAGPPLSGGVVTGRMTRIFLGGERVPVSEGNLILTLSTADGAPALMECFRVGEPVSIRAIVTPPAAEAIGGGPRLVRDGKISVEFEAENFGPVETAYLKAKQPRSAAGISRDKSTVYLVVVEGRSRRSMGADPQELASLMMELGSWDAIMFDGGGSAEMVVEGRRCGSGRVKQREICNALAVFSAVPFSPMPASPVPRETGAIAP